MKMKYPFLCLFAVLALASCTEIGGVKTSNSKKMKNTQFLMLLISLFIFSCKENPKKEVILSKSNKK
jgi:hypothetical protein